MERNKNKIKRAVKIAKGYQAESNTSPAREPTPYQRFIDGFTKLLRKSNPHSGPKVSSYNKFRLHTILTYGTFITGIIFGLLGVILVSLSSSNERSEFSFFGQTFKSSNIGIGVIFIAAAMIFLIVRRLLSSVDKQK